MRSTYRKRSLIVAGSVILLCMTVIIGMTFALFTDTQKVNNHLQAGDLKITLERVGLRKTTLTERGFLDTTTLDAQKAYKEFSNPTDANVFGIEVDQDGKPTEMIVPGSKFVSTMQISNQSDAAFKYWIKIACTDDNPEDLAEQLIINVYTTDQNGDGVLDDKDADVVVTDPSQIKVVKGGLEIGSDTQAIDTLAIGDKKTFVVSVEFKDELYTYDAVTGELTSKNDSAKGDSVKFDLIVYAVQVTKDPQPPTTP